jgi:DNA-binding MurR/RpiR family transcriptional regulator
VPSKTHITSRLRSLLDQFSGQRRKAAEYILARPGEVAVYSLRKVAVRARVSPGTLVTLAKTLGYGSYNAFRARVQQEEVGILDYFSAGAKVLQDTGKGAGEPGSLIEKVIRSDLKNITEITSERYIASVAKAAAVIQGGKNVYVVGRRATFGLMHYFYYVAQFVRDQVHLLDGAWDMSGDQIARVGPGDVVLCCGFYPYIRSVMEIIDEAETRGARVVCITDSAASPLVRKNGVVITLPIESPWIFGSISAAVVVLQALLAQLTSLGGEAVLARIKDRERLLSALKVFDV